MIFESRFVGGVDPDVLALRENKVMTQTERQQRRRPYDSRSQHNGTIDGTQFFSLFELKYKRSSTV